MSKILIIEDEPTILFALREVLSDEGYEVLTACSGEEGLDILHSNPPDLVLADLKLPGISGNIVLSAMQADEKLKEIPVLIITASERNFINFSVKDTFDALITKPFELEDVVQKVAVLLKSDKT